MRTVQYYVLPPNPEDEINIRTCETLWDRGCSAAVAEDCARHFYQDQGGMWEHWPIKLVVMYGGVVLGKFEVDRDSVPEFIAIRLAA